MRSFITRLWLLALAALSATSPAFAGEGGTLAQIRGSQFSLNNNVTSGPSEQLGTKLMKEKVHTLKAIYDFSKSGGSSTASIALIGEDNKLVRLPQKAIVVDCLIDVITPLTSSGSATLALGTGKAVNDLKTATAYASYTGLMACVPVGSAATAIKMTANVIPTATIATANLTAGKIAVLLQYVLSE